MNAPLPTKKFAAVTLPEFILPKFAVPETLSEVNVPTLVIFG